MRIFLLALVLAAGPLCSAAGAGVTTVDFLEVPGVRVNAAGPVLVRPEAGSNAIKQSKLRKITAKRAIFFMITTDCYKLLIEF